MYFRIVSHMILARNRYRGESVVEEWSSSSTSKVQRDESITQGLYHYSNNPSSGVRAQVRVFTIAAGPPDHILFASDFSAVHHFRPPLMSLSKLILNLVLFPTV